MVLGLGSGLRSVLQAFRILGFGVALGLSVGDLG